MCCARGASYCDIGRPPHHDMRFNSALTSRADSARSIIFFGTFLAVFASSANPRKPSIEAALRV